MEILVVIVAFCLVVLGVYGALPLLRRRPIWGDSAAATPRHMGVVGLSFAPPQRPVEGRARSTGVVAAKGAMAQLEAGAGGLFSEVDLLRAEVEQLRAEIAAGASLESWGEKSHWRRQRTGLPAELPGELRRQVGQARRGRRTGLA